MACNIKQIPKKPLSSIKPFVTIEIAAYLVKWSKDPSNCGLMLITVRGKKTFLNLRCQLYFVNQDTVASQLK